MNRKLKKILAVILSALMLMSMMAVGAFAEDAADTSVGDTNATETVEEEEHRYLFQVIIDMWLEFFSLLKYIFNDVFLGVPA